jgi:hypothetical protein
MSENEVAMIAARLDRIDGRLEKLRSEAVTWKPLLGVLSCMTAVITVVITAGTLLR